MAKQMPEPNLGAKASQKSNPLPRHPHRRNRFISILIPLLFVAASVAIGFGVATFLKNQSKAASKESTNASYGKIIPDDNIPARNHDKHDKEGVPSMAVPPPEQPSIAEPLPPVIDGVEPKLPGAAATEVLEKFLAMKTLAERLPMMETQTPEAELAKSCLAGPLPSSKFVNYAQESNSVEQVVDIYHKVDFDAGNNRINPQTILVRKRGSGDPKIVVDPFLDSYGGRLAAYAKTPSEKAGIFEVIISAVASCYDTKVPNHEKKLTLKLLPQDDAKEIALAYFGRQSKIGLMLVDGTYSLSYGKAKACTVMLRWNTEDNPHTPYLEAIDLKSLDWNP